MNDGWMNDGWMNDGWMNDERWINFMVHDQNDERWMRILLMVTEIFMIDTSLPFSSFFMIMIDSDNER
jgi:hypothetical protein